MVKSNISVAIDDSDLEIIDKACGKDSRNRSNYMVLASVEKAKRDLKK